ncbi:hypothetical protein U1Q18_020226 [Sarracenia purpurea var. burkii]
MKEQQVEFNWNSVSVLGDRDGGTGRDSHADSGIEFGESVHNSKVISSVREKKIGELAARKISVQRTRKESHGRLAVKSAKKIRNSEQLLGAAATNHNKGIRCNPNRYCDLWKYFSLENQ